MSERTSWGMLENPPPVVMGPLSKAYGFLPDPVKMNGAPVYLPDAWREAWSNLSHLYLSKKLRSFCTEQMRPISARFIAELNQRDAHALMKAKCIVYCITQAWVDCERTIGEKMQEPPALPHQLTQSIENFAALCHCPKYCTLADMSLTAPVLRNASIDFEQCTFDDFRLACPVFSPTQEPNTPFSPLCGTGISEQRFHNTPTMMEFRTAKLAGIFARIQKNLWGFRFRRDSKDQYYETPDSTFSISLEDDIVDDLNRASELVERLFEGFSLLTKHTVDPVDWHENIVKYTSGYHGNLGMSGPQTPCIHLLDAFLGRKDYDSDLGQTTKIVFSQLQKNHQDFVRAVSRGPNIRQFTERLADSAPKHSISQAYNRLLDTYCQGFLTAHKARAMEFALKGFTQAGPREFTAETTYTWPAPRNVVEKLRTLFDESRHERECLKL